MANLFLTLYIGFGVIVLYLSWLIGDLQSRVTKLEKEQQDESK